MVELRAALANAADRVHVGRRVHVTGPARLKLGAELTRAYGSGASIRTLADGCGRSYGFAYRVPTEAGTTMRSRGCPNDRHRTAC